MCWIKHKNQWSYCDFTYNIGNDLPDCAKTTPKIEFNLDFDLLVWISIAITFEEPSFFTFFMRNLQYKKKNNVIDKHGRSKIKET